MEIFKMCNVADYNDEGVIRLGEKCIEDLTNEYLARHNGNDLESYRRYLRRFLPNSWLRTVVDPDELIDCMERVRQEKLRNDPQYRAIYYDEKEIANEG